LVNLFLEKSILTFDEIDISIESKTNI
jgi:hypothetical protein